MDSQVSEQELEEYLSYADRIRGAIISHTVLLERNMDLFICRYFCSTEAKVFELMELLVSERTDFMRKTETFRQILQKECKLSGQDFNKKYPGIKTDLQKICETRNDFAHKLLVTPIKSDIGKHDIVLKKFKDESQIIPYTASQIDEFLAKIEKYSKLIKERNNS